MVDLILRPSTLVKDKPWALQLRYHESLGETEYATITRVSDETAKEIVRAGKPEFLFNDEPEPVAFVPGTTGLYALRHKSGVYMPDFKGRAGGTYVDPWKRDTHTGTPRLFTTPAAAKQALDWWAKGRVKVQWSYGGFDDFGSGPEMTGLDSEAVEGRLKDDWKVVPVGLHQIDGA